MKTYSTHRPTGFDAVGAFLPDRQDWFVAPVSQTRDSGVLDQSNFDTFLTGVGGESETVEVHRFGHWGPAGWYELILIDPADIETVRKAQDIESALADYPVLDDEDFSRREMEGYNEGWANYGAGDFVSGLVDKFGLSDSAADLLREYDDKLREFFEACNTCGDFYYSESSGVCVNTRASVRKATREGVAAFLRSVRGTALA